MQVGNSAERCVAVQGAVDIEFGNSNMKLQQVKEYIYSVGSSRKKLQ